MKSSILFAAAVSAGLAATSAGATILTFDIAGGVDDFENIPPNYGDNVTVSPDGAGHSYAFGDEGATPNVTLGYGTPGEDPALWTTGYGDLVNVHFNDADGDTTFTIDLVADAGYLVDLYGFDLASYLDGGQTIQGLSIADGSGAILYSQGETFITGTTHYDLDFGTPVSANSLRLVIDLSLLGGVSDDIGIDNIRFGQRQEQVTPVVPEPASWAMMIAGFGLVGGALRRRSAAFATA